MRSIFPFLLALLLIEVAIPCLAESKLNITSPQRNDGVTDDGATNDEDRISTPDVDSSGGVARDSATESTPDSAPLTGALGSSCQLEPYPTSLSGRLLIGADTDRTGETNLAVIDLDQRRITGINAVVPPSSFAAFSPDGTEVAMTIRKNGIKMMVRADWDGTNQNPINGTSGYEFGDWSGDTIAAFSSDGKILITTPADSKTSSKRSLVATPKLLEARLSPDQGYIAFTTTKFWPGSDVCLRTIGSNVDSCPLTGSSDYRSVRWNKSGELIAYSVGDESTSTIGIVNRKTKVKSTFSESDGRNFDPAWNPNGDGMIFANETDGKFAILFQETAGKPPITIANCPQPTRMFDWNRSKTIEVEALRVKRSLQKQ